MKKSDYIHRIQVKDRDGRVVGEKEVISYAGLLALAHDDRLSEITTTIVQLPTEANGQSTVVLATVRTAKGTFTGIGDANPRNVNPRVAPHCTRLSETRAIARALRAALNVGTVAIEELGDDADVAVPGDDTKPANDTNGTPAPAIPITRRGESSRATDSQRRYLYRLLVQRGIEGDAARTYLQRELGAASVADAPKHAVSALIDKLQNDSGAGAAS